MKAKDLHLLAFYVLKPKDPKRTKEKGYITNPDNFRYDESIEFTRGLNPKDQQYAGVVLNLNTKKVLSNRFKAHDGDFDKLFKYFLEGYPEYVIQVMAQLDLPYLEQFIPKDEPAEVTDAETPAAN
jgi:hypothetical protein